MKVFEISISKLKPYKKNAKQHPQKQVDLLAKNIEKFGFTTPLLISENNEVIAGHGRLLALKQLNHTKANVVRMAGLSDLEIKALRLADNKIAEMGEWDLDLAIGDLKELDQDLLDLTGFDKDLLIEADEEDDVIPENVPAIAKLGDLYILGNHRVLCGDSTKSDDVERLMDGKKADCVVTDPPYNTGMEGKGNTFEKAWLSHMFNDNYSEDDFKNLLVTAFQNLVANTKGQSAFYVFIDWRRGGAGQRFTYGIYGC